MAICSPLPDVLRTFPVSNAGGSPPVWPLTHERQDLSRDLSQTRHSGQEEHPTAECAVLEAVMSPGGLCQGHQRGAGRERVSVAAKDSSCATAACRAGPASDSGELPVRVRGGVCAPTGQLRPRCHPPAPISDRAPPGRSAARQGVKSAAPAVSRTVSAAGRA